MDDFQIVSCSQDNTILIWDFFGSPSSAPSQSPSQKQLKTSVKDYGTASGKKDGGVGRVLLQKVKRKIIGGEAN